MSKLIGPMLLLAAAVTMLGCAQQPAATAAVVEDKTYAVTPPSLKVKAGIISGEVIEMAVTERVDKTSGKVVSPAKLTGKLRLTNTSANQTVRLVSGKIRFIDGQGQAIKLEDTRTEPILRFSSYSNERLDPGQDATQSIDVDFPAEALQAKRLKDIRIELAYIPSPYQEQTVDFTVSIGAGK